MTRYLRWSFMLLVILSGVVSPRPTTAVAAPVAYQCFSETGQCLEGRFLEYWQQHGGLPVFGFPLTPARWEANTDPHGAVAQPVVWTQWFERARFEYHPGNPPPYDVLLGRLGSDRLRLQGRTWPADFRPGTPHSDCLWFPTDHGVCDRVPSGDEPGFRSYFSRYGLNDPALDALANSVALFGLPLSEPQLETNSSGDTVLTQWFERGRFEYHPGNPPESRVLLGLLGSEVLATSAPPAPAIIGATALAVSPTSTGLQVAYHAAGPVRLRARAHTSAAQAAAGGEDLAVAPGTRTTTMLVTWDGGAAPAAEAAIEICLSPDGARDAACLAIPSRPPWATGSQFIGPASPFRGLCRISRSGFQTLLQRQAAPAVLAERDPGLYWDAIVAHRVDPLFIAAIFQHESQMGRAGVATQTHSWGNTRAPSFGAQPVGEVPGRTGTFPVFANWLDGVTSTAARLTAPTWVYANRQTVGEIFVHPSGQVWAPAGDWNNPNGYLRAVLDFMNRYQEPTGGACVR